MINMICKRTRSYCGILIASALLQFGVSDAPRAEIEVSPRFGEQTRENRYQPRLVSVYGEDFNEPSKLDNGIDIAIPDAVFTDDPTLVIEGTHSLRMTGLQSIVQIAAAETGLLPDTLYEVVMRYRVLSHTEGLPLIGIGFAWPGYPQGEWSGGVGTDVLGDDIDDSSRVWEYRRLMVTGTNPDIELYIGVFGSDIVVDSLEVFRRESLILPAEPPLVKAAFPRLGNYSLLSAQVLAQRTPDINVEEVYNLLGMFDFLTGYDIDHTIGVSDVGRKLREVNPDLLLLPYFQSFVFQERPLAPPDGVAGLLSNFNKNVADEWFMLDPSGERLEEPNFPGNFQLNHTDFGAVVDGTTFTDYAHDFLARSVFPAGAWDGIHFDQAEWYPNPLLGEGNAFLNQDIELPPIDIDGDGIEDSEAFLYASWEKAFDDYFDKLAARFGNAKYLFGNAGEFPARPSVMLRLNGFQREFLSPFPILDNGDLAVEFPAQWYDLMERYRLLQEHLRAPQLINFQFTGYKLGTPTGQNTENGLEGREAELESRDYQRMRLGLTTVLMGNGFFGYDYVDNTTAPVWFDEYAVGANGVAIMSTAAKGYLGQPLGAAAEITLDSELVTLVDFETVPELPQGFYLGQFPAFTSDPDLVIDGIGSVVMDSTQLVGIEQRTLLFTTPLEYPLEAGETYHVSVDYRVLDFDPENFGEALFVIERAALNGPEISTLGGAALFDAESGMTGTVRLPFVAPHPDVQMFISMTERGRVVFDNIRVTKGAGGIYRRDFENGVVLVNPTPEPLFVPQTDVAGPLERTNIRRIVGTQDPAVNSGAPVTSGITIPPADGIVLLADNLGAPPPGTPANLFVAANEDSCDVLWSPASGTVAGYVLHYGLAGGDLTEFSIARPELGARIDHLEPGSNYSLYVTAFDHVGNAGPQSQTVQCSTVGEAGPVRPLVSNEPTLAPGSFIELTGSNFSDSGGFISAPEFPKILAGAEVLVNGVPVPVVAVEPGRISFIAPSLLGGSSAVVRVRRDGTVSPAYELPVVAALPFMWRWGESEYGIAFHADDFAPLSADDPARPGDRVVMLVSGVGRFEPNAPDGAAPPVDAVAEAHIEISIGGTTVSGIARPSPWFGFALLEFETPPGTVDGVTSVHARVGGITSNSTLIATGSALP